MPRIWKFYRNGKLKESGTNSYTKYRDMFMYNQDTDRFEMKPFKKYMWSRFHITVNNPEPEIWLLPKSKQEATIRERERKNINTGM